MDRVIREYMITRDLLLEYFGCSEDYFIKPIIGYDWCIKQDSGIAFFCYWKNNSEQVQAVVAKKDGLPIICRNGDYSMVVAIDCIKIAFILDSNREVL